MTAMTAQMPGAADAAGEGPLAGEVVAFTGRLATMSRGEARGWVARAGGRATRGMSRDVTVLVVGMRGWPLLDDGRPTAKLARAEELRRAGHRVRIVSETAFRGLVGLEAAEDAGEKAYTAAQAARLVGVEPTVLERWAQLGLVRPREDRYDFRDLVSLRTITGLVAAGVSPRVIRRSLEGLSGLLPGVDRPLAQLTIVVQGPGRLRAELEGALLAPGGQLELDFERRSGPTERGGGRPHPLTTVPRSAAWWVSAGVSLEREGRLAEAEEAYRRAAAQDPAEPAAHFNLGNVLLAQGRSAAAAERFELAAALDPEFTPAWFNLAHAREEEGRLRDAAVALRKALAIEPGNSDALYNLGLLLGRLEDREGAAECWKGYLALDPASEWGAEARRQLEGGRWERPA